ncbi:MAG: hypothetical protein AAF847_04385 [Bacteroidota bacterium]
MEWTTDQWLNVFGLFLRAAGLLVGVFVAWKGYQWAYKKWLDQKALENRYELQRMKYDAKLAAYKGAWSLISYLGHRDTPVGMFALYGKGANSTLYLFPDRVAAFNVAIEEIFYQQGHGLLLPTAYKNRLFEIRSIVNGMLYSKDKQVNKDGLIAIEAELKDRFFEDKKWLAAEVKRYLEEEKML